MKIVRRYIYISYLLAQGLLIIKRSWETPQICCAWDNVGLLFAQGSNEEWLKEILTKIAEVLKLQDIPAIQMQIVLLGSDHRDLR